MGVSGWVKMLVNCLRVSLDLFDFDFNDTFLDCLFLFSLLLVFENPQASYSPFYVFLQVPSLPYLPSLFSVFFLLLTLLHDSS